MLNIKATHLHAHRIASSLVWGFNRERGRLIGRTKGGLNSKLPAVTEEMGRSIQLFFIAGNVSDYIGARALLPSRPTENWMLADRGYYADLFREGLKEKASNAASHRAGTAKILSQVTQGFIEAVTRLRICSDSRRIGAGSRPLQ